MHACVRVLRPACAALRPVACAACGWCLQVEDDSLYEEGAVIPETGYVDEAGELRRPWCAATRILEHRETVRGCVGCMVQGGAGRAGQVGRPHSTRATPLCECDWCITARAWLGAAVKRRRRWWRHMREDRCADGRDWLVPIE